MKKSLIICLALAALLLIGGGVFAAIYFGNDRATTEERATSQSPNHHAVFYINLDQLIQKSGIHSTLTDVNRSVLANVITQNIDDRQWTEYTKELLSNLDNSGIDTMTPIYGYVNNHNDIGTVLTLVAEVDDVEKVDRFMEYISTISNEEFALEKSGQTRTLFCEEEVIISYDNNKFVVVVSDDVNSIKDLATTALNSPKVDLKAYAKYDIAYSVIFAPILDATTNELKANISELNDQIAEYNSTKEEYATNGNEEDYWWEASWIEEEILWCEQQIESYRATLKKINAFSANLSSNANLIMGILFEDGTATAELSINGVKSEVLPNKMVTNEHLAYIDNGALVVLNAAIEGDKVSDLLAENITSDYADMFGIDRNEFNIYTGILIDAIESIDGDLMIALNDLYGGYYGISSAELMAAMSVKDDYIISTIGQFGTGFLAQVGDNKYNIRMEGQSINLGQIDDTFYATMNMDYTESVASAKTAPWVNDVEKSYGYLVLNVDDAMQNNAIAALYRDQLSSLNTQSAVIVDNLVDAVSYTYITIDSPKSAKMVIVFDDRQTNSLKQIVKHIVPLAITEVANNY